MNLFCGNKFQYLEFDEDGCLVEKDSFGCLCYCYVEDEEVVDCENYKVGQLFNFFDGDQQFEVYYDYGCYILISDQVCVYKGGFWVDCVYWLFFGICCFKDEIRGDCIIGFCCVMICMGVLMSNDDESGYYFKMKCSSCCC